MVVESEMRTTRGKSEMDLDEVGRRSAMRGYVTRSIECSVRVKVGDVGEVGG